MTVTTAKIDDLMQRSGEVVSTLARDPVLQAHVNPNPPLPRPFYGSGDIRLVIVGQDPTVANENTRKKVTTALMLNGKGHLTRFLSEVWTALGLSSENVYATNLCKNFFEKTPTQIEKTDGVDVIGLAAPHWLPVLRQELAWFPEALVITLGEPVVRSLVRPGFAQEVKSYWGYRQGWASKGFDPFCTATAEQTVIKRGFFPLVHLNTNRKSNSAKFYQARFKDCLAFLRDQMRQEVQA
jgi:uracil-DNA glycosylase